MVEGVRRQRFTVELRSDETTVVSWKKLVKDSLKTIQPPPMGAHPALEARIAPEAAATGGSHLEKDPLSPPAPNRFNAVIEKIERLYKGGESSDEEELDNVPDDDQYDTEDSFIDDTELDEYFSVDKAKTKHTGFFINRGKLERVNEPAASPVPVPKRKRKDARKISGVKNVEEIPKNLLKLGGVRIKAAARSAPLVGTNVANCGQDKASLAGTEHLLDKPSEKQELISPNDQAIISRSAPLKDDRSKEVVGKAETSVQGRDFETYNNTPDNVVPGSKDSTVRGTVVGESSYNCDLNQSDKQTILGAECQTRESVKDAGEMTSKFRGIEKASEDGVSRDVDVANKLVNFKIKSSPGPKEASPGRPKCTMLEKAFQDLEKGVAELCPSTSDIRESDQSSQGVKKRLPRDVKLRLAKVARLAAKQGKISDEVIDRLMNILGHVMRLKTLKRNLKEMVELGISAKQEKEGKLQDIKREVTEMVQMRVSSLQTQDIGQQEMALDNFQAAQGSAEKGTLNGYYKWDFATEDRLCDLYDQYVEGMDEHRGPQIRKLYLELAELWPEGWMDNHGVKHAVYRAKERKKRLNKLSNGGVVPKRKKSSIKLGADGWNGDGHAGSVSNPNCQTIPCDKPVGLEQAHSECVNGGNILRCRLATTKSSSILDGKRKYAKKSQTKDSDSPRHWDKCDGIPIHKKKLKTKPNIDSFKTFTSPMKTSSLHSKEMHKLGKQGLDGMPIHGKGSIQVAGLPAYEVIKID